MRHGSERLRAGSWRGDRRVAYLAPVTEAPPPSAAAVRHCTAVLARRGYDEVITGALTPREQRGFLDAGFDVREHLHLLAHDLDDIPTAPAVRLRRARRRDRGPALAVDGRAFEPFWRLDESGLDEALSATPSTRFRIVPGERCVLAYAITGRAGRRGYLQRLAVDPQHQRRGLGAALVVDSLRWLRRRGVDRVVVNTQVGNVAAVRLYERLGFRLQPGGLAVLRLPLAEAP